MEPKDALLTDETRDLLETLARGQVTAQGHGPDGAALFTLEAVEGEGREHLGRVAAAILRGFLRAPAGVQRSVLRGGMPDLE